MSSGAPSWAVLVDEALARRIRVAEVVPGLYPLEGPANPHATPDDLAGAQSRLAHPLNVEHAHLLERINGWTGGLPDGDLLGTDDLGHGPLWQQAHEVLSMHYGIDAENRTPQTTAPALPNRDVLTPFLVSEFNDDPRVGVLDPNGVVHLFGDGSVLETWSSLREFWMGQIGMLRRRAERYEQQRETGTLPDYATQP